MVPFVAWHLWHRRKPHPGLAAVRARRRRRPLHAARPRCAGLPARQESRALRGELTAARDARSNNGLWLGQEHVVRPRTPLRLPLRLCDVAQPFDPHRDLGVGGRELGAPRATVAQPDPERVGVDREVRLRKVQRCRRGDRVVRTVVRRDTTDRGCELLGRTDGRLGRLAGADRASLGTGRGHPLVLRVRDDHGAVVELDLVAGAVDHDLGRGDDARGRPVRGDQEITDRDLAHRRPARRRGQRRVEREGLADGWARRDDDHLAGVQAVGEPVEVGVAGGDAGHALAAPLGGLDLVERGPEDLGEGEVVLRRAPLRHGVDLGLGVVDDLVDVAAVGRVAELHDARARLDEAAQDRTLADDARVVPGVGGGRHAGHQVVDVGRAADALELAALGQLRDDGDGVGGLAATVEVDDRLVDDLVRRAVEVRAADLLDDVRDGVLRQQHAAEHAHLGGDVLGRRPVEPRRPRSPVALLELLDRHAPLAPPGTGTALAGPHDRDHSSSYTCSTAGHPHDCPGGRAPASDRHDPATLDRDRTPCKRPCARPVDRDPRSCGHSPPHCAHPVENGVDNLTIFLCTSP